MYSKYACLILTPLSRGRKIKKNLMRFLNCTQTYRMKCAIVGQGDMERKKSLTSYFFFFSISVDIEIYHNINEM